MGFQDRDYSREDDAPPAFVTSVVVKLIILNAAIFLADALFGGNNDYLTGLLSVSGDTLEHPLLWWKFLTAGFVHAPKLLNHIFFNMLGLYFFGKPLEERFGSSEFLRFYLVAVIVGMVLWSGRVFLESLALPVGDRADYRALHVCYGASGGVTACVILFCLLNPRATILHGFLFPIPAWLAGLVIVVQNLFGVENQAASGMRTIAYDVHLFGAAFAPIGISAGIWGACRECPRWAASSARPSAGFSRDPTCAFTSPRRTTRSTT
jgi:membrane associated rhomboid family serine protease